MRAHIIIYNSREKKQLRQQLEEEYGITKLPEYVYFSINKKERVYIAPESVFQEDQNKLRVNAFGMYIGTIMKDGFRFSLEGAQLFGPLATKNIVDVGQEERNKWFQGEALPCETNEGAYVLVRNEQDYLGSGKVKDKEIINYLAKARKLTNVFVP